MRRSVILFCVILFLQACANSPYDSEREWRLRQCEKILDNTDRKKRLADTPHYN